MNSRNAASDDASGATLSVDDFQERVAASARVEELNERILTASVESGTPSGSVYRVGPEDSIGINIFGVADLSGEYRIDGSGVVLLPLVGPVEVGGMTLAEVEKAVADAYGERFIRNPRVSVSVTEYRSNQVTMVGALQDPKIYNISRQITLVQALSMAGGVTPEAGGTVSITDRVSDPDTQEPAMRTLFLSLDELIEDPAARDVVLGDNAVVNVPRGGHVYVEGAVSRPGAYRRRSDTSVLKVLSEAGGVMFEADTSDIRVMRRDRASGEWESFDFRLDELRNDPASDRTLENGDVVLVGTSAIRSGWMNFIRILPGFGILRLFAL